jgi:hypothetical protein
MQRKRQESNCLPCAIKVIASRARHAWLAAAKSINQTRWFIIPRIETLVSFCLARASRART